MVFLAEIGDKSQLACMALAARHRHRPVLAGMAGTLLTLPIRMGATLALLRTLALGVVAGRKLLKRISPHRLHQFSGVIFLILAAFALTGVFGA